MLIGEVLHQLKSASDVAAIAVYLLSRYTETELDREIMLVFMLDQNKMTFRQEIVSMGSEYGTMAYPKQVFRSAIQQGATYIVLLHTHQKGNEEPSQEDLDLTRTLISAGKILDLIVLDHVVLSGTHFTSIRERTWSGVEVGIW